MRDTTLNIRTSNEIKQLLQQVANMLGTTVSGFLLNSATEKAYEIMQNQAYFSLNDKEWNEFCNELDRKPVINKHLQNLILQKGVFEDE